MNSIRTDVVGAGLVLALGAFSSSPRAQSEEIERLDEAGIVFEEVMGAADSAIPRTILRGAAGIAVFPSTVKGGLIIGAHRGRGVLSARMVETGEWSAPAFLTLTGGSIGAQIGGQAIDLVLVVMNRRGLENLVKNQFKIGGDASVAAGPIGRDAEASTDIQLRAQILSYSRTRGLFAGVTLKGTSIRQDRDANERFYDYPYRTRQLIFDGRGEMTDQVRAWTAILKKYTE
jgi:lipid-binding SYLF domain-containing protein